ncbi:MAG TPA: hypothetical protein VNJ01_13925 [Bacteriovoracaceae bacterium]|nr:hypothetical protein [Bacteriovoracaceae bacterium]
MSFSSVIKNYKHDIAGKFLNISSAINPMTDDVFKNPENNELFHAVHEVLLKMVRASRNTILQNLNQNMTLVVSDKDPDPTLLKLQIEGLLLRHSLTKESVTYYLFTAENPGNLAFHLGKVHAVLPVKEIRAEIDTPEILKILEEVSIQRSPEEDLTAYSTHWSRS